MIFYNLNLISMYFKEENGGYLIYDHDFDNKSLPFDGWFHNCIFCSTICGSTIHYDHPVHFITILCCKDCKIAKKIENNMNDIDMWIDRHLPRTRRKFFCNCK